jgi:LuxR family transcriptional regulator, glucitol operon activator
VDSSPKQQQDSYHDTHGLGAYNFPLTLRPFNPRDSRFYFRRTAQIWGVNVFHKLPDETVLQYCERLQHNPLFIKWFIQTVRAGRRPEAVLANPKILLQFCLQNVFEYLTEDAKLVAWALLTLGGSRVQSAIAYVTGLPNDRTEIALTNLISANVISMKPPHSIEQDAAYGLSPLAQYYLANSNSPSDELQQKFIRLNNELRSAKDEFSE